MLLTACDLKPAPKKNQQTPSTAPAGSALPLKVPTPSELYESCEAAGKKWAEFAISSVSDPTQRAAYEQERATIVRKTAQSCEKGQWDAPTRQCFIDSKSKDEIEACAKRTRPTVAPQPPGAPPLPDTTGTLNM